MAKIIGGARIGTNTSVLVEQWLILSLYWIFLVFIAILPIWPITTLVLGIYCYKIKNKRIVNYGFRFRKHRGSKFLWGLAIGFEWTRLRRFLSSFFCQNNLIAYIFFSDFLMAVLREAMLKNPQLKLILMSATLDTELFLSYFDNSCHIQGYYTKANSKMLLGKPAYK